MAFPRILIALSLIAAGAFIPAAGPEPTKAPAGTVGMTHEFFATDHVTVRRGDTLTFVNSSRYMHIIGPGRDGTLADDKDLPMHERVLMPTNDTYTIGPFEVLGTYYVTCSMHPEMTVKIVVTD